ncbi:hypothetical protein GCM10023238_30080 [Streptomyces heliomycini]
MTAAMAAASARVTGELDGSAVTRASIRSRTVSTSGAPRRGRRGPATLDSRAATCVRRVGVVGGAVRLGGVEHGEEVDAFAVALERAGHGVGDDPP